MGVFDNIKNGKTQTSSGGVFAKINQVNQQQRDEQGEMEQAYKTAAERTAMDAVRSAPVVNMDNSPVFQKIQQYAASRPAEQELPGRDVPVLGPVLRTLDKVGSAVENSGVGPLMRSFYVPGASGANLAGLAQSAETAVGRALPGLGGNFAGRMAQKAAQEALVGAPLGAAQYLSNGGNDLGEAAKQGAYGAAFGGALGAAGPVLSKTMQKFGETKIGESLSNLFKRKGEVHPEVEQTTTDLLNSESAPQKTVTINGKLTPATQEQYINKVMTDIKPIVTERMTPPLENPKELAKWLQPHLGVDSLNEMRRLSYDDMVELANEVRQHLSTYDVARQVAKEKGYDLEAILSNKLPNLTERIKSDSAKRAYGVYDAPKMDVARPVSDPNFVPPERPAAEQPRYTAERAKASQTVPATERVQMPVTQTEPRRMVSRSPNERGFIETLKESPKLDPTFVDRLKGRYKVLPNEKVVEMANKRVSKDIEEATSFVLGKSRASAEKVTTAHRLIDEYSKSGNHDMAVTIAESIAEELTRAGQTVQAASIYNRLTPEGVLVHAQRLAKKVNESLPVTAAEVKVTPEMAAQLTDIAATTQKMTGVKDLASNVESILERAKTGAKLTEEETAQLKKFVEESKQFVKEVEKKPRNLSEPKPPKDKKVRENVISFLDAQEAKAKERLRARGIRVSSTPLDVWADYAIVGASKMAKGLTKFSMWAEDMAKEFGEEIRPHLSALYEKAKETFELSSKKISQSTYNQADKIVERVLKDKQITEDEANNIRKMAQQVLNLSGDAKRVASQDLQAVLNTLEKPGILKKVSSVQTMSQLLNPKTLLVRNPLGNELFYRLERINKLVAAPIDWGRVKLFGGQRSVTFRTHNQGEYWRNWLAGWRAGWKGVNPEGLQTQFDISGQAFNGKWNPLTYLEKTMGATLKSFDYAAYKRAVNNTIGELATLRSMNEGLTGEEAKTAIQKYIREADENVLKIADEYGRYITFQDNNAISKTLTGLKRTLNAGKDFGLGDLVIKYPKTPGALLMRALEYSPAGFLRSAAIAARPILRKSGEPNTAEAMMALTRAIIGTAGLSGFGWYLLDKGILTGSASKDKDIRDLQRSAGQGQYQVNLSAFYRFIRSGFNSDAAKIRVSDELYTYDWAQPVSMAISLGANMAQNVHDGKGKGDSSLNLLQTAYNSAEGGLNSLVEQSVLQGVKKAVEGYPGQSVMDKITDILSDVPSSFVPSALNQIKQLTDNASRETYSPDKWEQSLNKAKSRIPGASGTLPQQYDTLGKPKQTYQNNSAFNVLLNPGKSSKYELSPEARMIVDLINETGDENLAPRVPGKTLNYKDENNKPQTRKLTTEEFARIQQIQGEATKKNLDRLNPNMSTLNKQKAVKDALNKSSESAQKQLKKEIGVR